MTMQLPSGTPAPAEPSRRRVLCGLAAALLVPGAMAAACEGNSNGGAGGGGGTGAGAATSGVAGASGAPGAGAAGTPLAKLSDVPVGGGVIANTPNGLAVLVQPAAGTVRAFSASCTHQGTTVGTPRAGVITCPNHGSQFDAVDGSVRRGPAASPLAAIAVRVEGADVVLA